MIFLTLSTTLALGAASAAAPVPDCTDAQLLGYAPQKSEVDSHRTAPVPVIDYEEGAMSPDLGWGFEATLRIDAQGRVECARLGDGWGDKIEETAVRREWRATLSGLRYEPFLADAEPLAAIVVEPVHEVLRPAVHRPMPEVPLEQVRVELERTECYGTCPAYRVEIRGDGQVTWVGRGFVDVVGEHRYRIPVATVAALLDSLRDKDLWSLRERYEGTVTDNPTTTLRLRLGGEQHTIVDYVGEMAGMPPEVTAFQDEVDAAAGSRQWVRLGPDAVDWLDESGFDFASADGEALLARAASSRESSDGSVLARLLELGARGTGAQSSPEPGKPTSGSVLEAALRNGHVDAARLLIEGGALLADGEPDAAKTDAAFKAAIAGGRLAAAQLVWSVASGQAKPALAYDDVSEQPARRVPVTLLLARDHGDPGWEGRALAEWLAGLGCDLTAHGADSRTLLHIAADADDAGFVRYLLEQGLDANAPGAYGLPAIGSTQDEEVALLLLQAGSETSETFREFAVGKHWRRVLEYLDATARADR